MSDAGINSSSSQGYSFNLLAYTATLNRPKTYSEGFRIPKDNETSKELHETAKRLCADGKYREALKTINKSICFAETGTSQVAQGFVGRSMIFLKWHERRATLKNSRLLDAEKNRQEATDALTKLTFPTNPRFSALADCLEICQNERFGRHIITTCDLEAAKFCIIERPNATYLPSEERYHKCSYCYREAGMDLIPCQNCTSVMFCGAKCHDEAQTLFHRIECGVIDYMCGLKEPFRAVSMRSTIKALQSFDSVDELMVATEETLNDLNQSNFENRTPHGQENSSFQQLVTPEIVKSLDRRNWAVFAWRIRDALLENTPLTDVFTTQAQKDFLLKFIFRQMLVYTITSRYLNDCLVASMYNSFNCFNHSCVPNVYLHFGLIRNEIIPLRSIKKGEQLFICFWDSFLNAPLVHPGILFEHRFAACKCKACENDYLGKNNPTPKIVYSVEEIADTLHVLEQTSHLLQSTKAFDTSCVILDARDYFMTAIQDLLSSSEKPLAHRPELNSIKSLMRDLGGTFKTESDYQ